MFALRCFHKKRFPAEVFSPVWNVLDLGRKLKRDGLRLLVCVLLLGIFELHVSAKLIPCDGTFGRPIDLLEERVDLGILKPKQTTSYSVTMLSYPFYD